MVDRWPGWHHQRAASIRGGSCGQSRRLFAVGEHVLRRPVGARLPCLFCRRQAASDAAAGRRRAPRRQQRLHAVSHAGQQAVLTLWRQVQLVPEQLGIRGVPVLRQGSAVSRGGQGSAERQADGRRARAARRRARSPTPSFRWAR